MSGKSSLDRSLSHSFCVDLAGAAFGRGQRAEHSLEDDARRGQEELQMAAHHEDLKLL